MIGDCCDLPRSLRLAATASMYLRGKSSRKPHDRRTIRAASRTITSSSASCSTPNLAIPERRPIARSGFAAHQKLMNGNDKALTKSDMLFDANPDGPIFEGKVTVPAGSVFFIIENRDTKEVEFHLQCFAGG